MNFGLTKGHRLWINNLWSLPSASNPLLYSAGMLLTTKVTLAINHLKKSVTELTMSPVRGRQWSEDTIPLPPLYWLHRIQTDMTGEHWSENKLTRENGCKILCPWNCFTTRQSLNDCLKVSALKTNNGHPSLTAYSSSPMVLLNRTNLQIQ